MSELLDAIEIETGREPDAVVIWMHGLGDDGRGWSEVVPALQLPDRLRVRFLFPHAPVMPVSINQGFRMRAWYDVRAEAGVRREDAAGVREAQSSIEALIAREKARGVAAEHVVLAGFSQGGAMALHTGLRHPERLAGIMALSCFLPLADHVAAEASAVNRATPIFFAHGIHDPMIPLARAQHARDALTGLGYRVEWHEYPMPHSVTDAEVLDIAAWLARILA